MAWACIPVLWCGYALPASGAQVEVGTVAAGARAGLERYAHAGHADYALSIPDPGDDVVEASRVGTLVRLHRAAEHDLGGVHPPSSRAAAVGGRGAASTRAVGGRRLKGT
ncbi:MAG TPA: hypothetical protein VIQ62_13565 [Burkholderiales bacterium]